MCLDEVLDEPLPKEVECYMVAYVEYGPYAKRVREGDWVLDPDTHITGRVVKLKNGMLSDGEWHLIERDDGDGLHDELAPTDKKIYYWSRRLIRLDVKSKPVYRTVIRNFPCPVGKEVKAEEPKNWDMFVKYPWGFHRYAEAPELSEWRKQKGARVVKGILRDIVAVGLEDCVEHREKKVYVGRRWTALKEV